MASMIGRSPQTGHVAPSLADHPASTEYFSRCPYEVPEKITIDRSGANAAAIEGYNAKHNTPSLKDWHINHAIQLSSFVF
ncbi:MAG: hypothetical protein L0387_34630 [Acidobacteria bacterium]|nr:hypothetical protein [Acidobacteriota bacterium]